MGILDRLRRTQDDVSGVYGPNSTAVDGVVAQLRLLTQDELMWLAAAYGAARGQIPGSDPQETKPIKGIWAELVKLPLARIDRRDRPASRAVQAGAEAVLAAIWATGLEPPEEVRRLASSGGADLALLMTVRSEADPDQFAVLWNAYTCDLPNLRALL